MPTATCLVFTPPICPECANRKTKTMSGSEKPAVRNTITIHSRIPECRPVNAIKSQKQVLNRPIAEPGIICIECLGKGKREMRPEGPVHLHRCHHRRVMDIMPVKAGFHP